ncbi:MAG: family 10 glycosylhydrolase, partial [Eubacterium sp.]|nr:family 10 glycosylhydrolase [Eubacterium sp.]
MKKIIIILISLAFVLCSCSISENNAKETTIRPFSQEKTSHHKTSVFITYYELQKLIDGRDESEFEKNVLNAFNELKETGFNTVTVQVRAFADAFYKSDYFPLSRYCFGEEGGELKYDALEILCSAAEKVDLNVEAWVNPYRISFGSDINELSDKNLAKKWFKNKKTKSRVYICKKGIYFNPASDDVIGLIRNGVFEIAENYPVSAVLIDDYFYA